MPTANIDIVLSNGTKAGKTINELRQNANRLTKEVNNLTPGTDKFIKKSADLQKVQGRLKGVRNEVKGVSTATSSLFGQFSHLIPFSGQIQQITGAMKGLRLATMGVKAALISTGIGAIVVLLGSLVAWLTTTQEGMGKLTAVTRPLQTIFARLLGVIQDLGGKAFKKLAAAIEDPKQAFIDIGNAIKENLINRLEALSLYGPAIAKIFKGQFAEGFKDLGNAHLQLITGVEDVIGKIQEAGEATVDWIEEGIEAGTKLNQINKRIEIAEISMIRRRGALKQLAKELNFIVEDETKTLQEREIAAQKALDAQKELMQIQVGLIDLRLQKMKLEQTLNDTSRADLKELAELEEQRAQIIESVVEMETTTRNKLNIIRQREATERENEAKKELQIRKNIEDLTLQSRQEGMAKEIDLIHLQTERKIEALIGTEEQIRAQKVLLQEIEEQAVLDVINKYAAIKKDQKVKAAEEDEVIREKRIENEKNAAISSFNISSNVIGALGGLLEEGGKSYKEFATAQVILSTIAATLEAYKSTSAIPIVGPALAPFAALTAALFGATQLSKMRNTDTSISTAKSPRKLQDGGLLVGPSHANGGIPGFINYTGETVEMEGNEFIFSGRSVNAIGAETLDSINRQFANGGPINPISTNAPTEIAPNISSANDSLVQEFRSFREDVNTWQTNLQVHNNATDTANKIDEVESIKQMVNV